MNEVLFVSGLEKNLLSISTMEERTRGQLHGR